MTVLGMILFWGLLFGIPCLCITAYVIDDNYLDSIFCRILKGIFLTIVCELLFIIAFGAIVTISYDSSKSYIPIDSTCVQQRIYTNLVDTNSNDFLISIKNENKCKTYNFYVKDSNNIFTLDEVKTDNFNIAYSDIQYPYIEYHRQAKIHPTKFLWILEKDSCITDDDLDGLYRRGTIYLPKK
jgi:hypothetical protein